MCHYYIYVPNRRDFFKHGSRALASTAFAFSPLRPGRMMGRRHTGVARVLVGRDMALPAGDPLLRTLAARALDAARSAGASYADIRFTLARSQQFLSGAPSADEQQIAVGVRAFVNGCWGFVASPEWTPDEMVRLGREAAAQARVNNWGATRAIELSAPPPPATGTWSTPHARDPFVVVDEEKMDYIHAAQAYVSTLRNASASSVISFKREDRTFASTDGAFCAQTLYTAFGDSSYISIDVYDPVTNANGSRTVEFCTPTAGGYELLTDSGLLDAIPRLYDEAQRQLTTVRAMPGRYDVVFDAMAMAGIVSQSIGEATEIDRARGFEANAGGTSYLSPVATMLGARICAPLITITANRSSPLGAASVKWDDEGVSPDDFTLVDAGTLVDYATSREHVTTLAPWYQTHHIPLRSHGCANSGAASDIPLVYTPNLRMTPASSEASFEDLVSSVHDGLAVVGGTCRMDYRKLTGEGTGEVVYRIKNGKLGEVVMGGSYLIRATEFWQNVAAIGGPQSLRWCGLETSKGQPEQQTVHSVGAVPALVRNIPFVDETRGVG